MNFKRRKHENLKRCNHTAARSSRPAWLQPWPRKPWKQWKPSRTSRTWGISLRKSIGKMWFSEVLIFFQWSSLLFQWSHMVSESIRSYDSVPAKTSDRLGLTAETCREVTIFARHERPLKGFWTVYACSSWFSKKFLGNSIWLQSFQIDFKYHFNHKTFFQSKTV